MSETDNAMPDKDGDDDTADPGLPGGQRATALKRKDLLGIEDLDVEEINLILDTAHHFKEISQRAIKKVPTLRGKSVINLFFEPSTRTRTSFEIAAKRLSADTQSISGARHATNSRRESPIATPLIS